MKQINVGGSKSYPILLEKGILRRLPELLPRHFGTGVRYALMTDDHVAACHGAALCESLGRAGLDCSLFVFPHGESHKTLETWAAMLRFLAEKEYGRGDCVLALGGGVTGDLAGFAAATHHRGMKLVQLPTSLLAMVDSSVGGKTGFDHAGQKNNVGAFYPPELVITDPELLETLPEEDRTDGIGEVVKYGMIGDEALFRKLNEPDWQDDVEEVLERCIRIKAELVTRDEEDRGERRLLNFGHSFGHGMEVASGFGFSHGRAVACGMMCAARAAAYLGYCDGELPRLLRQVLERNHLPMIPPVRPDLRMLWQDKKRQGDRIVLILPKRIGHCEIHTTDRAGLEELYPHIWPTEE